MNLIAQLIQQLGSASALTISNSSTSTTDTSEETTSIEEALAKLNSELGTDIDKPTYEQMLNEDGTLDVSALFDYLIEALLNAYESDSDDTTGASTTLTLAALSLAGQQAATTDTVNIAALHDVLAQQYGEEAVSGIFDQNGINYSALSALLATGGGTQSGQILNFNA